MILVRRVLLILGGFGLLVVLIWFDPKTQRSSDPWFRTTFIASTVCVLFALSALGVRGAKGLAEGPRILGAPLILVLVPFALWQSSSADPLRFWIYGAPVVLFGIWLTLRLGEWWLDVHESSRQRSDGE